MMLDGRPPSEVFVFILICFTAGKCNDLSCYVCAEFLLAGAALDVDIGLHLVIAEAYKLQRNDISSLMQQLIRECCPLVPGSPKRTGPVG